MATDKLRIGIMVDENCLATEGGGYSYYKALLHAINRYAFHPGIEIVNILFSRKPIPLHLEKQVIVIRKNVPAAVAYTMLQIINGVWYRTLKTLWPSGGDGINRRMAQLRNRSAVPVLQQADIDLVYYLKPEDNLIDYPVIITHWDVGHKSMYPFPEVAMDGNGIKREKYYAAMMNRAFLILCESEAGAAELLHYYPVNPGKVRVLPIFGGEVLKQHVTDSGQQEILLKYNVASQAFFLYPAQFWAHKNHYNLVMAFHALIREKGNGHLKLVCCGTDKGNMKYIRNLVVTLGMAGNVLFPGFVDDQVLYTFYKNALSLVMPTFLGPTNIPLIEAAHLGCPVVCSQLQGHLEIMGDTALYFDPADAGSIKNRMREVTVPERGRRLAETALERITASGFDIKKSIPMLQQILLKIIPVRKAWGTPVSLLFWCITCV